MRRQQHRPDPPIGGLSYRNNEPGVSRCRSEIANLASDTSERRSARVNERTDDAARGRLSRALLALGDHNRQGGSPDAARRPERLELISSRGDRHLKKGRNSSRLAAALRFGQRLRAARAAKPRRRSLDYPPALIIDRENLGGQRTTATFNVLGVCRRRVQRRRVHSSVGEPVVEHRPDRGDRIAPADLLALRVRTPGV